MWSKDVAIASVTVARESDLRTGTAGVVSRRARKMARERENAAETEEAREEMSLSNGEGRRRTRHCTAQAEARTTAETDPTMRLNTRTIEDVIVESSHSRKMKIRVRVAAVGRKAPETVENSSSQSRAVGMCESADEGGNAEVDRSLL